MKGREHRPDFYILVIISIYDFDSFYRIVHNLQVMREARVDQSSETQTFAPRVFQSSRRELRTPQGDIFDLL